MIATVSIDLPSAVSPAVKTTLTSLLDFIFAIRFSVLVSLAKALTENGFDAHALDANIIAMKHPDGMTSLESGSVKCHLTSSPYIFYELDNEDLHELTEVYNAWSVEK
ncbi:MAG: hypothetical protein IKH65_09960, partial [Clostridia bacterium]|nr:hypothetical protein [Clostridia bacterium]